MLRMLWERVVEIKRDMYVCSLDCIKALDKVGHEEMLEMLQSIDIDGKDIQLICNLYWKQTAAIRIKMKLVNSKKNGMECA